MISTILKFALLPLSALAESHHAYSANIYEPPAANLRRLRYSNPSTFHDDSSSHNLRRLYNSAAASQERRMIQQEQLARQEREAQMARQRIQERQSQERLENGRLAASGHERPATVRKSASMKRDMETVRKYESDRAALAGESAVRPIHESPVIRSRSQNKEFYEMIPKGTSVEEFAQKVAREPNLHAIDIHGPTAKGIRSEIEGATFNQRLGKQNSFHENPLENFEIMKARNHYPEEPLPILQRSLGRSSSLESMGSMGSMEHFDAQRVRAEEYLGHYDVERLHLVPRARRSSAIDKRPNSSSSRRS